MVKKLLTDRFGLKFHADKIEMPAYVLTVGKDGAKLSPSNYGAAAGHQRDARPRRTNNVCPQRDARGFHRLSAADCVGQAGAGPDRVEWQVRFPFHLHAGCLGVQRHPPRLASTQPAVPAPSLFDAIREQIGLDLDSEKTFVDVIAVDVVQRP